MRFCGRSVKPMRYLLLLFLVSISYQARSQMRAVTFYDSAWALTSKERHVYYRVGIVDTLRYQYYGEVSEFYKNGKRLMQGNFKANVKQDTFYFYYPSGQLRTRGIYQNNLRKGIWTNYYESGKIKERLEFDNILVTIRDYYDENGAPKVIDGNGKWKTVYDVDPKKALAIEGVLVEGRRNGAWTYQLIDKNNGDTTLYCTETFKNGKFTSGKMYAEDKRGQRMNGPQMLIYPELTRMKNWGTWDVTPYATLKEYPKLPFLAKNVDEVPASFKGGFQAMGLFIGRSLRYPSDARSIGKEGDVFVSFIINSDGTVEKDSVTVVKSVYPSLDAEAVRVVKSFPPWMPGVQSGKPVRSRFMLPVKFRLGTR
ncbi:energy transducer TonB [Chryseolinea soli]|uniref:TonB family protein n=1 Tax=Chryseolinea soli TaxID=2321403 RepID=A0A385SK73_9BACT|nr:energy transducer TonB [Chryseolinea soli]AYB31364.1 TonB family protein [Chryseolinea soli]